MPPIKTNETFVKDVEEIVGHEYTFLEKYRKSNIKIKVRHEVCGQVYSVTPNNFLKGARCPQCRYQRPPETDIEKEIRNIEEGGYEYLGGYESMYMKIKVRHTVCGREYEIAPYNILINGSRCRECVNKGKTKSHEEFLQEVDELYAGEYIVEGEYTNSFENIPIRHEVCGKVSMKSPNSILRGSKCYYCSPVFPKTTDEFVRDVYKEVGAEYTVLGEYIGAHEGVKLRHECCGHEYEVTPRNFINKGSRCPKCVYSRGERIVEETLEELGVEYRREWAIGGVLRADFYLPGIRAVIEYDGEQHFIPVKHWGGEESLKKNIYRDEVKNWYCHFRDIRILRIPYWEKDNIPQKVTEFLQEECDSIG